MSDKIIFVDIDGPLLPGKMFWFPENRSKVPKAMPRFDEFAVRAFNIWAKYSSAKIVLSTNWAWNWSTEELKHIMQLNGLGFDYHSEILTPKRRDPARHNEILNWLAENSNAGDTFIVVDDDSACEFISPQLNPTNTYNRCDEISARGEWIKIDYYDGISVENFKDGCAALGIDLEYVLEKEFRITPVRDGKALFDSVGSTFA